MSFLEKLQGNRSWGPPWGYQTHKAPHLHRACRSAVTTEGSTHWWSVKRATRVFLLVSGLSLSAQISGSSGMTSPSMTGPKATRYRAGWMSCSTSSLALFFCRQETMSTVSSTLQPTLSASMRVYLTVERDHDNVPITGQHAAVHHVPGALHIGASMDVDHHRSSFRVPYICKVIGEPYGHHDLRHGVVDVLRAHRHEVGSILDSGPRGGLVRGHETLLTDWWSSVGDPQILINGPEHLAGHGDPKTSKFPKLSSHCRVEFLACGLGEGPAGTYYPPKKSAVGDGYSPLMVQQVTLYPGCILGLCTAPGVLAPADAIMANAEFLQWIFEAA
ncbi:hypothetical protein F7725_007088 [Dissostichus mawsoni]|uniref:Uncharacterized protein n=1 Tax=Dissostichus mawsoni TaxID=36200 RepID=A0A7J5XVT2_DISMA|nr:hypothetical protein F7725_007088 [Dissostichus mawsoni]